MMAKYRFKVRDGIHKDGPPGAVVTYKKGDVVESDYPLDKMFVNKFDRLMSGKKGRKSADDDEVVLDEEPNEHEQAAAIQEAQEIAREADEEEEDVKPLKGRTLIEDVERAEEEDTEHAHDPEPEEAPPVKKRRRKKRRVE